LIIITGRNEEAVGKPLIYATSKSFMDYFGINSAAELPQISEVFLEEVVRASEVAQLQASMDAEAAPEQLVADANEEAENVEVETNADIAEVEANEVDNKMDKQENDSEEAS
jgi:segregation and condensation protein B